MNHLCLVIAAPGDDGTPTWIARSCVGAMAKRMPTIVVESTHTHQGKVRLRGEPIWKDLSVSLRVVVAATDHDHRNAALALVRAQFQEYDRVWVVDSDEAFTDKDFADLKAIVESTDGSAWFVARHAYWKSLEWRIEPTEGGPTVVCINPRYVPGFQWSRNPFIPSYTPSVPAVHVPSPVFVKDIFQHHLTAVRSDEEMAAKISSFVHGPEIGGDWFENVWKGWTPEMENLHPTHPPAWKRAVKVDPATLPEALKVLTGAASGI